MREEHLVSVLNAVIPARGSLAAAGDLGLSHEVLQDARDGSAIDQILAVLHELPADFDLLSPDDQQPMLLEIETRQPEHFAALVNMVYTAYYSHDAVLAALSGRTGYNPSAPQPTGYVMEPFDESLLAPVKQMPPLWRQVN